MEEETSLGKTRAKRQRIDKSGKSAAFERLKSLKGKKNKCEIGEIENVYDEIDEKEYSKRVLKIQDDDWLERPGDGYIEDGREIFDDDEDDDEETLFDSSKKSKSRRKSISGKAYKSTKSILQMVANMPVKKKKVEDDAVLDDLMGELKNNYKPKGTRVENLSSKDYLLSISKVQKKNLTQETQSSSVIYPNKGQSNEIKTKIFTERDDLNNKNDTEIMKTDVQISDTCSSIINNSIITENETLEEIDLTVPTQSVLIKNAYDENQEENACLDDLKMDAFADDFDEAFSEQKNKLHSAESKGTEELISNEWEPNTSDVNAPLENITIDKSDLPIIKNEQGENVLRIFWWDAYEDPYKQPGIVYLFGKVFHEREKTFVSCCVCIENIERRIFILPREKKIDPNTNSVTDISVSLVDVYQEFNAKVANPNKIMNFKSRRVVRKYVFDLKEVPEESEYLEVKYPSSYPRLPQNLTGETFSRVFGTNTGSLELLLLEQKIKGPCWLEVKNPQIVKFQYSWCKIETRCLKPDDVVVSKHIAPPPPLLVMGLNIRSVVNTKNMENEIIMISWSYHEYRIDKPAPTQPFKHNFCALTRPVCMTLPHDFENFIRKYKKTDTSVHQAERSLLNEFLTKLCSIDPDVLVGHDLYGFTLETLLHRIQHFKISNWSRIGRLKRALLPQLKGKQADKNVTCGRLVCDLNISARELVRARNYDLDSLCKQLLHLKGDERQDFSSEEIIEKYEKTSSLINLINCTMKDTIYILRLLYEFSILPLTLQITNIAGNVMSRTLLGGRSERNEFLLLHAFTEKNYLVPDKNYSKKGIEVEDEAEVMPKSSKKKPQYAGGLVLEPKKGFYDKFVLLMDFNSLYPSIIQEYNICFTTVQRMEDEDAEPEAPRANLPLGVLPTEIQKLVESRRQVKALMKTQDLSPDQYMQYNIRQMALKLTANSMYGCLGFPYSRFYAKPLAALVTSKGREILMNTKDVVQKMNYEVIYGDTDSIMINTNCTDYNEVFKIGHGIKQEINKVYKYVELEIDGVFKYILLLKKKKYAAVVLSKRPNGEIRATQEFKGLDIVRRDWCQLSAEVGRHVLNQILSDLNPDERLFNIKEHLERIAKDLREKIVPVPLLAITKQLNKNPEDYPDKKSLPHLQVALRINSRGGKKLKAGDAVPYVICDDGSNLPAVQRAYHVDELKNNANLLVDVNYYLSQQIHPVVSRLCEPIHGADPAFVAQCLGLDQSSYKKIIQKSENEELDPEDYILINDFKSFKHCEKFTFQCINENCKTKIFMDGPMRDNRPALSRCRNPSCNTSPIEYLPSILNSLNLSIRYYVGKLYQNWMICEDPACPNRTQRVPMAFRDSFPICTLCKKGLMYREFRNADLYYQLKYFEFIFNIKRLKLHMDPELENGYKVLQERAVQALNQSAYRTLDMGKIFKFALKINKQEETIKNKEKL